ncbi:hypothetical protein ACIOZM_15130 [Pseudomonas sp. NPDC087346]|uniref:hypothetical protein n=1 Tax=Pseudomonas sp. NPDC087346 TaxID=3364438 RepID=UPI00380A16EA
MMDWVMGAYSGIKAATDITQSMLTLKTDAAVTSKVIELNGVLLSLQGQLNAAQMEQSGLAERIRTLEADISKFQRWDEEKARYKLHQFPSGAFAYVIKPESKGDEPSHYLCALCIEKGMKVMMQPWGVNLKCNSCTTVIPTKAPVPLPNPRRFTR